VWKGNKLIPVALLGARGHGHVHETDSLWSTTVLIQDDQLVREATESEREGQEG
jgi:hypothetical protein